MVDVAGNAEKPNDATRASRPAALVCEPAKVVIEPDTPTLPPVMFEFVDTVFPTLTVPETDEVEAGLLEATTAAPLAMVQAAVPTTRLKPVKLVAVVPV